MSIKLLMHNLLSKFNELNALKKSNIKKVLQNHRRGTSETFQKLHHGTSREGFSSSYQRPRSHREKLLRALQLLSVPI